MAKKALITGATSGIGLEFAKALTKEGYNITLVSRDESKLKKVISALGKNHKHLSADLSTDLGINKISKELEKTKYDLLINNAGAGLYKKFNESNLKEIESITKLNCDAVVALSHSFLKNSKSGDAII